MKFILIIFYIILVLEFIYILLLDRDIRKINSDGSRRRKDDKK